MSEILVVGSGLYGLTIAREAAEAGHHVTLLERRTHLGGNAWSEADPETGIEVHTYGSHIFHTSNREVWEYVNRFTSFTGYSHRVYTTSGGEVYPLPVNLATINQFFHAHMSPDEARVFIASQTENCRDNPEQNFATKGISLVGKDLFEAFFAGYTAKQWQTDPSELPAAVMSRLPVRYNYNNRYFSDPYEGLPAAGYAQWLANMAAHPNIETHLSQDFLDPECAWAKAKTVGRIPVVYTGALDAYFDYRLGALAWRTIDLETEVVNTADFQGTAVMNYADRDVPFTRIHEFRHFHPELEAQYPRDKTVIAREYSRFAAPEDEPYYPVNTAADRQRVEAYIALAVSEPRVWFGGRLGTYRYLDMDKTIALALQDWRREISKLLN